MNRRLYLVLYKYRLRLKYDVTRAETRFRLLRETDDSI